MGILSVQHEPFAERTIPKTMPHRRTLARWAPLLLLGGAAAMTTLLPLAAFAWQNDTTTAPPPPSGAASPASTTAPADVTASGVVLFRIWATSGNQTPQQRADTVQARLVDILSEPDLRPRDIRVAASGRNEAQILVRRHLLVTATAEDGKANGKTALAQANAWADSLRTALPRLSVKPNANNAAP